MVNISIIGGGVSGMTLALMLQDKFNITLFENYMETEFEQMNESYHKGVICLLKYLNLDTEKTKTFIDKLGKVDKIQLSFSVSKLLDSSLDIELRNDYSVSVSEFIKHNKWINDDIIESIINPFINNYENFPILLLIKFYRAFELKYSAIGTNTYEMIDYSTFISSFESRLRNTKIIKNMITDISSDIKLNYIIKDSDGNQFYTDKIVFTISPQQILSIMHNINSASILDDLKYDSLSYTDMRCNINVSYNFIKNRQILLDYYNGKDNIYYSGYYTNGIFSSEDAFRSSLDIVEKLDPENKVFKEIKELISEYENFNYAKKYKSQIMFDCMYQIFDKTQFIISKIPIANKIIPKIFNICIKITKSIGL